MTCNDGLGNGVAIIPGLDARTWSVAIDGAMTEYNSRNSNRSLFRLMYEEERQGRSSEYKSPSAQLYKFPLWVISASVTGLGY